jgi:hypothetical protein
LDSISSAPGSSANAVGGRPEEGEGIQSAEEIAFEPLIDEPFLIAPTTSLD